MNQLLYSAAEVDRFVLFSSLKGSPGADWMLMRSRNEIDRLRPEAKAMLLLLAGKSRTFVEKAVPSLPREAWELILEAYGFFEPLAEARREEAKEHHRHPDIEGWAALA